MNRRTFLKILGLGSVVLGTDGTILDESLYGESHTNPLKNWVWIPADPDRSMDSLKRLYATMRESGIRAIMPEIYNGRHAYFASTRLPVKTDLLGKMLPLAKAEGLEVHAWMWCMPCLLDDILRKHPDWYTVNAKGESAATKPAYVDYYKFLDPGRPEVREFVQGIVKELAAIPELTGVHLDYIRHPDAILPRGLWSKYNIVQDKVYPAYDYGYSEYERERFKEKYGVDPLHIKDPTPNQEWMQFRWDMVTDLVNKYLVPAAHDKAKMITAAVFPGPMLARQMVRQDWGRWDLDAFLPMLYSVFYAEGPGWVRQQTREGVSTVNKPIYSGLYIANTSEAEFRQLIENALEGGASGVSLFSADEIDEGHWSTLRKIMNSINIGS
jgi:uncharacterized lipoprotein YddW (UPF0748 family)